MQIPGRDQQTLGQTHNYGDERPDSGNVGSGGPGASNADSVHRRWKTAEDRTRWLRQRLRDGYALLELDTLDDACVVWLEAWRELLTVAADVPVKTLGDVFAVVGLPRGLASWSEDFGSVARWLDAEDAPYTAQACRKLLHDLAARFPHENTERLVDWACSRADLVRLIEGEDAGERAYKRVATTYPDRAQVVKRWVDARLDVRRTAITLPELRACSALLNIAMRRDYVDDERHMLRPDYEAIRADIHRCEAFGTKDGPIAWPYFEVFSWAAPQILWHLEPYAGDLFDTKWGEFLYDIEPPVAESDVTD